MSRSSRSELASLVGAGLIVVALVGVSVTSTLLDQQRQNAEASAKQAEAEYREAGVRFSLLSEVGQRAATYEGENARQEREKSDLDAQWATAKWTLGQFVVGILGLVGLGFTVIYARAAWMAARGSARADYLALKVSRTQLNEARNAAGEAFKISKRQSRAYVRLIGASYDPPTSFEEPMRTQLYPEGRVTVQLENFGETVARCVIVRCEIVAADLDSIEYRDPSQFRTTPTSIAPREKYSDTLTPRSGVFSTQYGDDRYCVLRGEVRYSDIYGARFRSCFVMTVFRGVIGLTGSREFSADSPLAELPVFDEVEPNHALGDPQKTN